MKCPNCRSEIGSQPSCPYCGTVFYYPNPAEDRYLPYGRTQSVYSGPTRPVQPPQSSSRSLIADMHRRLNGLELRSRLVLILMSGIFVLQILILLVVILC